MFLLSCSSAPLTYRQLTAAGCHHTPVVSANIQGLSKGPKACHSFHLLRRHCLLQGHRSKNVRAFGVFGFGSSAAPLLACQNQSTFVQGTWKLAMAEQSKKKESRMKRLFRPGGKKSKKDSIPILVKATVEALLAKGLKILTMRYKY